MALIDFEELSSRTLRMTLVDPLSVQQTLVRLRDDADFRVGFSDALATLPFVALRWETPRMTADTLCDPFEAVVIDSPSLDRAQDADAFADQFETHAEDVLTVPNLGGDALMVVPRPMSDARCYCHLASFLRGAPEAQRHALWVAVAEATLGRVGSKPLWLSTAGGGVAWLHVRLDARPKYYEHTAYKLG